MTNTATGLTAEPPEDAGVSGGLRLSVLHAEAFRFPEPWAFPPAELPYWIIRLITSGTGEIEFDGRRYAVSAGNLVVIPEGAVLECRSTSPDFAFGSIRFSVASTRIGTPAGLPPVLPWSDAGRDATVRTSFAAVIAAWAKPTPGRALLCAGYLSIVLGAAANRNPARAVEAARMVPERRLPSRVRDPRIAKVIDRLAEDLAAAPDTRRLCALTHMSESTLRRTFKDHTGKTIGEYQRELRMGAAARKLAFEDGLIGDIAAAVGLPDANYFARSFREVFGLSPREYRRLVRET